MRARPGLLLPAALLLQGCFSVPPPPPRTVSAAAADAKRLAPMLQASQAGPLRLRSVVYKPSALPLGGFFKKLARGQVKPALASVHFGYAPSNVDDRALRLLIKHGYVPVFVEAFNAGDKPLDGRGLALSLRDASLDLAPIPNAELPDEFSSLDPKALAADAVNVPAAVLAASVLVVYVFALSQSGAIPDEVPYFKGTGNDVLNPVRPETPVDYNGLLFNPGILAPGGESSGLVFFKARGADWSGLRLHASLRP